MNHIIKEPSEPAKYSIICLHGLGADAEDLVSFAQEIALPYPTRFIFPNAPVRPITAFGFASVRGWYDIKGWDRTGLEDEVGIRASAERIATLIENEKSRGILSTRIFLVGFSQGGAMSLYTGLRYLEPLGGLAVLSGYLPLASRTSAERQIANHQVPIFMAHGRQDTIVPFAFAQASEKSLQALGYRVQFRSYEMAHAIVPQELTELAHFLSKQMG